MRKCAPGGPITESRLERRRTQSGYNAHLKAAYERFCVWLQAHGVALAVLSDAARTDAAMVVFLNRIFENGEGIIYGRWAVLGVQRFHPGLGPLRRGWRCLDGWARQKPSRHRTPLPASVMMAASLVALDWAARRPRHLAAHLWFRMSTLLRLGFHGLLRPGELLQLSGRSLLVTDGVLVVALKAPKNAKAFGANQFVVVRDAGTVAWAQLLRSFAPGHAKLWPGSPSFFRKCFCLLMHSLGAGGLNFTPASLRAGGATSRFLAGDEVPRIKFAGRWASERSLGVYLQEAVYTMVGAQLPPSSLQFVDAVCTAGSALLDAPPDWAHALALQLWRASGRRASWSSCAKRRRSS